MAAPGAAGGSAAVAGGALLRRRSSFRAARACAGAGAGGLAGETPFLPIGGGELSEAAPPYATHLRLSGAGRAAVAVGAALGALQRPGRADLVAALGETTGGLALQRILARMRSSDEGRRILSDRPQVSSEAMARAWELPSHTFGGAYAEFMGRRRFSPDDRPPPRFRDCPEEAFVAQRAREVHDFWHVLFGCPTTVLGELSLKALEFVQTGLPVGALSLVAAVRLKARQRRQLFAEQLPWALRAGRTCPDLICLYYEENLEEDLQALRARWNIVLAPEAPGVGHEISSRR